jgi:hypothetical protein
MRHTREDQVPSVWFLVLYWEPEGRLFGRMKSVERQDFNMTTSHKHSDDQPPHSKVIWPNVDEAIKLIDHLLETNDKTDDISDWEELKKLLDQDRLSGRKLFPNE